MFEIVRQQIGRTVPFARLLGIVVDVLARGRATASVAEAPDLLNHVGTLHAGVLFSACEAATGAALVGALLPVIMRTRFVVREARIEYLKPAKGALLAQAMLVDDPEVVLDDLQRLGCAEVDVDVCARTTDAVIVAKATFHWSLKLLDR